MGSISTGPALASAKSYLRMNPVRMRSICMIARLDPMHFLGPPPKGI